MAETASENVTSGAPNPAEPQATGYSWYVLSVLVVVIVGGLDSLAGALVGGVLIGLVEALAGALLGGEFKLLATFVVLVSVLLVRPYGLFGTHEIERL